MDWLLGIYLPAGACAHAQGGDLRVCQSNCRGFSGLDYSPRAGRYFHAVRDGDHHRVSGAGEYVEVEAGTGRYTGER